MAYVSNNLNVVVPRVGQNGSAVWTLTGTDVHTDIDAVGFISDGDAKGLRPYDVVLYTKTSATVGTTAHAVQLVTPGGAATLSPAILA